MTHDMVEILLVAPGQVSRRRLPRTLSAFQQAVGGYLENLPARAGVHILCDEQGAVRALPFNPRATALARALGWSGVAVLRGPVLFCGLDAECEETDVPPEVVTLAEQIS